MIGHIQRKPHRGFSKLDSNPQLSIFKKNQLFMLEERLRGLSLLSIEKCNTKLLSSEEVSKETRAKKMPYKLVSGNLLIY